MTTGSPDEIALTNRFLDTYHELKKLKKVKNKTDFCARLNMPAAYISFFEKGERVVPPHYVQKLREEFNISENWLRYNRGDMFEDRREQAQTGGFSNVQTAKASNIQGANISTGSDQSLVEENRRLKEEVEKWRSKYIELLEKQLGS